MKIKKTVAARLALLFVMATVVTARGVFAQSDPVILTSPLLVYGGHPSSLLSNPAADMIKSIPSVWDETRVLPPSEIGELAMFARRSGSTWFVAAMNGRRGRTVKVDLSFLPRRPARALLVRDNPDNDAAVVVEEREITGAIEIPLRDAGGFVLRVR